ncbi:GNAT family N-acetyltransferase [Streptomyces sp. NPDC046977]|uniref:GNAT family N-acetyltransferase n=1 Tax=Streptomyces sp. NPDC046977 TaxID=3154703 RepID=UPI0033CBF652
MSTLIPFAEANHDPSGHPLDNLAWTALTGPHSLMAERYGRAARYPVDVAPFAALEDPDDPGAWADLASLIGPGAVTFLPGVTRAPAGWTVVQAIPGVEMVGENVRGTTDPEASRLGLQDTADMLGLVARAQPGPFKERTVTLGAYFGIWYQGRLVAMAGERLRGSGWTEISAVCTDPSHRGRGLAGRLVRTVAAHIQERGDTPFLQAAAVNSGAIRLYSSLGFTMRRHTQFTAVSTPRR